MTAIVEMRMVVKAFPGQIAVDQVDLALHRGEVHGLVGENGSGKSTLIKCLAGYHRLDGGSILVDGVESRHRSVPSVHAEGLRFIYQDPAIFPSLSVAENLAIGGAFGRSGRWRVRWGGEKKLAAEALRALDVEFDLDTPMSELTPARRTMVAVARALMPTEDGRPVRLLVLDEPTAALPEHEVESLFKVIRTAARRGVAILYVSHRIEEIFALTDRVTVLRDARLISTSKTADLTERSLVAKIIGEPEDVFQVGVRKRREEAPVRLQVKGLRSGRLHGIDFEVRRGEVVGIAGLLGSGRSRIARVLFGAEQLEAGEIFVDDRRLRLRRPEDAIKAGMALVPEDRRAQGAFVDMSVAKNLTIADVSAYRGFAGIAAKKERADVLRLMDEHDVRPRDPEKAFALLSGGNQQKVVLARWIRMNPKVIVLDEPTQGIDVQAKEEILKMIDGLSAQGVATLFISSDHTEYERICDRVLVLRDGQIAAELARGGIGPGSIAERAFMDVPA